ncbi:MAG: hypothetical protein AB1673_11820 [Actinomycetota bacterium]
MRDGQPVLLSRRRRPPTFPAGRGRPDFSVRTEAVVAVAWVETCATLEEAWEMADERTAVLNKLAALFDADTAVSLYRHSSERSP